ncbi:hypothetical protein R5R35_011368 [Gryllus longicercus]|uniref:EB domain-containing protein n=1 Tax=Gryllus longicercus TaxID=2509291 RepID=A0AAN9VXE9_9ORTH
MGIGDDCKESAQCQLALGPSAECRSLGWDGSFCQCIDGAHEVDNRCYNTSKVGERCVVKNNCRIEGGPTLTCDASVCVCPRLQHGSSDGLRCLEDRHLGDRCFEDDECVTTNSQCMGICKCRVSYVADEKKSFCLRVADSIGDMCTEDLQCNHFIPDSECSRSGECTCIDGYHPGPQGVRCWRSSFLGESCGDNNECLVKPLPLAVPYNDTRTQCVDEVCRCADGYEPDESGRYCKDSSAARPTLGACFLLLAAAAAATWARV